VGRLAVLAVIGWSAGCEGTSSTAGGLVMRDSAGIVVVENHTAPGPGGCSLAERPLVEIGRGLPVEPATSPSPASAGRRRKGRSCSAPASTAHSPTATC
jgi:hypothetical protein